MNNYKQIEIDYDAEGRYFLIILRTKDDQTEVLTTDPDPENAEGQAESYAYNFGIRYVAQDICWNDCGRNLPPAPERPPTGTFCAPCAGRVPVHKCFNGYPYPKTQSICDCGHCDLDRWAGVGIDD